jgi:DNA-binding CsgD family transcriptional regulator
VIPRGPTPAGGSTAGRSLLTPREAEVIPMLQCGRSNPEIAAALQIGVETVRTHARNIYRKLGVSSRRELAAAPALDRDRQPASATRPPRGRISGRRDRLRRGNDARHA